MARMNCKLKNPDGGDCGIQIDYNPDTKTAKNLDGTDHIHAKKKSLDQRFKNIEERLDSDENEIRRLGEALKALVFQVGGQSTIG